MRTITLKTAQTTALEWHGGQWSALYGFASSGELQCAQEPLCLAEIEENLSTSGISAVQAKRLRKLKTYFQKRGYSG